MKIYDYYNQEDIYSAEYTVDETDEEEERMAPPPLVDEMAFARRMMYINMPMN